MSESKSTGKAMNRARIREIAEEATDNIDLDVGAHFGAKGIIESAILQAVEELLTQEPSEEVIAAACAFDVLHNIRPKGREVAVELFRAMSAQLLKEFKDG